MRIKIVWTPEIRSRRMYRFKRISFARTYAEAHGFRRLEKGNPLLKRLVFPYHVGYTCERKFPESVWIKNNGGKYVEIIHIGGYSLEPIFYLLRNGVLEGDEEIHVGDEGLHPEDSPSFEFYQQLRCMDDVKKVVENKNE